MTRRLPEVFVFSAALLLACGSGVARACPFCSAVSQTFSEEITTMDVVVIARLVETPPLEKSPVDEVSKAKFEITEVIKGDAHIACGELVETVYFGQAKLGSTFLVMGVDPPKVMWSTPLILSERGREYISKLMDLPVEGGDRLKFFQDYLEDKDEMLARDAYDEFARASYAAVKAIKSEMHHDQLVKWIRSVDIPASRRRLYLTMLGVCGGKQDLPMLEELLKSDDRKQKAGLDAMIACYLTLKGPGGMPLVEDLFLKNKDAEYADTYAAIMALRFHGSESEVIPKERLLEGFRHMLGRPQLADLVIPDLARAEDWSVMPKLVDLFKNADKESSWVRVPVINYLRACPLPKSKEYISDLEKVDPEAVRRANTFFPLGPAAEPAKTESSRRQPTDVEANTKIAATPTKAGVQVAAKSVGPALRKSKPAQPAWVPNLFQVVGVPFLAGIALMLVQWSILRGAGR